MANFNPTNPAVSATFVYSYIPVAPGTSIAYPTVSAYGAVGISSNTTLSGILSGYGNASTFTVSAYLNFYAGTSYNSGLTALSTTFTGLTTVWLSAYGATLSAIQPPSLTLLANNGTVLTQGYIASSTINPSVSTCSFTIDFDSLQFRETTITLSGNKGTIIDNGSVYDTPFYQNSDMTPYTGIIPTGPLGAPGLSSTNLAFRTVAQHARRIGQENP